MDSDHTMMEEVKNAGLDLASVEELRSQLKQYSGNHRKNYLKNYFF